jgi:hypothetical protein
MFMTPGVLGKIVLWWLGILLLAIVNGALRERLLIPHLGPVLGLVVSGLILSAIVVCVALIATPTLHYKGVNLWWVGLMWFVLTVSFEFTFGLAIQHKTLSGVVSAYTFKGGNLWILVLLTLFVSPRLAAIIRGLH